MSVFVIDRRNFEFCFGLYVHENRVTFREIFEIHIVSVRKLLCQLYYRET
jgi:hypothetical protein